MQEETTAPQLKFRRIEFALNSQIPRVWCANDPVRTHFANAFSILLPSYERLFISTVSSRAKEIGDPALKEQAKLFSAQEGQHAAIHRNYNRWLIGLGYTAIPRIENRLQSSLRTLEKWLPKRWLLAITAGGEHITSFMANDYLSHPEKWITASDPTISAIWQWHAAEEIEHKAVCFDVYQSLEANTWVRRITFLAILFQTMMLAGLIQFYLLWKDGLLFKKATWIAEYRLLLGARGFLSGVLSQTRKYVRKDFHPWNTRDGYLVSNWENVYLMEKSK